MQKSMIRRTCSKVSSWPTTRAEKIDSYSWPGNKKELVTDLMVKAKQVDYLIQSLPEPEAEDVQVRTVSLRFLTLCVADASAG